MSDVPDAPIYFTGVPCTLLPVFPGRHRGACEKCGAAIWIGPRIKAAVFFGVGQLFCLMCLKAAGKMTDQTQLMPLGE